MKSIFGFGVNDADYRVYSTLDGVVCRCPAYVAWVAMITRCYSDKYKDKFPTYNGVSVCDEWRSFMAFRKWWLDSHVEGWHLDKDLLSDERHYSPSTCIYIPNWLNLFLSNGGASRGKYPIGVSIDENTGRFCARCKSVFSGGNGYIGKFGTADEAYQAWLKRKLAIALELKPMMDSIDLRIYERVVGLIHRIK